MQAARRTSVAPLLQRGEAGAHTEETLFIYLRVCLFAGK